MNRPTRSSPGRSLTTILVSSVILSLVLGTCAYASDIWYSQNFNGLTLGSVNNQDGWHGTAVVENGIAVSGNGLYVTPATPVTRDIGSSPLTFSTSPASIYQTLSFDILFQKTVVDSAGTFSLDIQDALQLRAPVANKESFLVYKAGTDSSGAVNLNQLEFRTAVTTASPTPPLSNVWYHVVMFNDFLTNTFDGLILNPNGSVFWNPAPQPGWLNDGNLNYIGFSAGSNVAGKDAPFFLDNVVVTLPEPASACLLLLGALPILRRRSRRA